MLKYLEEHRVMSTTSSEMRQKIRGIGAKIEKIDAQVHDKTSTVKC